MKSTRHFLISSLILLIFSAMLVHGLFFQTAEMSGKSAEEDKKVVRGTEIVYKSAFHLFAEQKRTESGSDPSDPEEGPAKTDETCPT